MPNDPVVPRVVRRHLGEPSEAEAAVESAIDRQVELLDGLLAIARELDWLRHEAHAAIEASGEAPLKILARIGARHQAAVLLRDKPTDNIEVIYSDGGVITENDVARLLGPRFGSVKNVRFVADPKSAPNVVLWTANNANGERITGGLLLHAALRGDRQVVSWAEIVIDGDLFPGRVVASVLSDAEVRAADAARQARALITRIRRDNNIEWKDVVAALVSIVEVADG